MKNLNFFDKIILGIFLKVFNFYQKVILENATEDIDYSVKRDVIKILNNTHPWFGKEDIYIMLVLMLSPIVSIILIIFLLWG